MIQAVNQEHLDLNVHDKDQGRLIKRPKLDHDNSASSEVEEEGDSYSTDESEVLELISHIERQSQVEQELTQTSVPPVPTSDTNVVETVDSESLLCDATLRQDLSRLGPQGFLEKYLIDADHEIRAILCAFGVKLPPDFDQVEDIELLGILRVYLAREFNKRERLAHVQTVEDVVTTLKQSQKVLVITGAGISTSLGIPDFRSENGIYSKLEKYNLSDPQELFDIHLFRQDPSIFYDFCKELVPENRGYSVTHAFIRLLQDRGVLLRQYTQNIDDIESTAGIKENRLIQCHGSFKTATCLTCHRQRPGVTLFPDIKAGRVPMCQDCLDETTQRLTPGSRKSSLNRKRQRWEMSDSDEDDDNDPTTSSHGVMKPDITFFGEQLNTKFKEQILLDRSEADLVICLGTSLRVAPVAEIPNMLPKSIPQVFISREPAGKEYVFDVELVGNCDEVVRTLADAAGWSGALESLVQLGKNQHGS